jgi:hypothetical protein
VPGEVEKIWKAVEKPWLSQTENPGFTRDLMAVTEIFQQATWKFGTPIYRS